MSDHSITGGDLYILWHAAHDRMPKAREIFDEIDAEEEKLGEGDESKFGPAFGAWKQLLDANRYLMQRTSTSIETTCEALDAAIEHFSYVDGDNSKKLTAAGEDLKDSVDKYHNGDDDDDDD